jgi:hypothetical protein
MCGTRCRYVPVWRLFRIPEGLRAQPAVDVEFPAPAYT